MAVQQVPQPSPRASYAFKLGGATWEWYHLPLLVAFASFLLTPILIWKAGVPAAVRWVGDAAVALMLVLVFVRMLSGNRIPFITLPVIALSIIGFVVALFEGQSLLATAWGWWLMFKYPLVGLFVYLAPDWPDNFAGWLPKVCVWILGIEVTIQAIQYLGGEQTIDHIAGTFGRFGTGPLVLFVILTLCMGFGLWMARGQWRLLLAGLVLGSISSVLGEMKLFPIALLLLSGLGLLLVTLRGGKIYRAIVYVVVFAGVIFAFAYLYNSIVTPRTGTRIEQYLFETDRTDRYLSFSLAEGGQFQFGRNFALTYGWETIQRDVPTFLFGMGLGTRRVSTTFGLVGEGLQRSYYGTFVGTSLLILMQEVGIVGLLSLAIFSIWIVVVLLRSIRREPDSDLSALRYAVILFTVCWPLWLWYNVAWTLAVPMLLYWTMVGYVLRPAPRE